MLWVELIGTVVKDALRAGILLLLMFGSCCCSHAGQHVPTSTGRDRSSLEPGLCECTDSVLNGWVNKTDQNVSTGQTVIPDPKGSE